MAEVRWTPQAADDLEAICLFIAGRCANGGDVRRPGDPRLGRMVPELGIEHIREIIVGSYRVIYRLRQDDVQLLTVHHGARPLDTTKIEAWG